MAPGWLTLEVYRKVIGGLPMFKHAFKLSTDDIMRTNLSKVLRDKITSLRPKFEYLDSEISSMKAGCGTTLGQEVLLETIYELAEVLDIGKKFELELRIDAKPSMGRTDGRENNTGIFTLIRNANTKSFIKSTFSMEQLRIFLDGYEKCTSSKAIKDYCRQAGDERIPLGKQTKTLICYFLKANNLGYTFTDNSGEKQCMDAMLRVNRSLLFIRKFISSFSVDNLSIINNNAVLSRLSTLWTTRINEIGAKPKSLSSMEIRQFFMQVENEKKKNKNCWPSSYYRNCKGDNDKKVGQAILDLEEDIMEIARRTLNQLDAQANRRANRLQSISEVT